MSTRHSAPGSGESDDDLFTLTMVGFASLGAILAVAGAVAFSTWHSAIAWLVKKDVLIPATEHPWVAVPYSRGAGLDVARVVILTAIVILLLVSLVDAGRRHHLRRREEELR